MGSRNNLSSLFPGFPSPGVRSSLELSQLYRSQHLEVAALTKVSGSLGEQGFAL